MPTPYLIAAVVLALVAPLIWRAIKRAQRAKFIQQYNLPAACIAQLRQHHAHLKARECQLVVLGLRQYFLASIQGQPTPLAMPSRVAGDLWLAFSQQKTAYQAFCQQAFGRFVAPAPITTDSTSPALRLCWWRMCEVSLYNPAKPDHMPLLFALDLQLKIQHGFTYEPDELALKGGRKPRRRYRNSGGWAVTVGGFSSGDGGGGDGGGGSGCDGGGGGGGGGACS